MLCHDLVATHSVVLHRKCSTIFQQYDNIQFTQLLTTQSCFITFIFITTFVLGSFSIFQKSSNSIFQSPALTAVHALQSLFSNVSVSMVIADMVARLAPGMSALYSIAALRANQKVFSTTVLEKVGD